MPALPAALLRIAPRRAAPPAGTAWRDARHALALPFRRVLREAPALVAALPLPRRREHALERTLEAMADRVARAELALLREEHRRLLKAKRAEAAEAALVRLQDTLDQLRREQRAPAPAGAAF
ncbi:hypothetical protein [Pseudoroseomonas cervicalis]|uniref:hypothetical protein n=1 Tax=Teichococcus cervicalis TaxID=204525 RepID=UPI0022F1B159|nr:hypothetical protein [Pseudoroseomonas cervicalis]WBV45454.1 hypothetical protein PFY06_21485 [Pseudoroseomonas cervicalis]